MMALSKSDLPAGQKPPLEEQEAWADQQDDSPFKRKVDKAVAEAEELLAQQHLSQSVPTEPHDEKGLGPGLTSSATEVDQALDPKAKSITVEGGVASEETGKSK